MEASEEQPAKVEQAAQAVLDARARFPNSAPQGHGHGKTLKKQAATNQFHKSALADHYDPVAMPPRLAKAHESLDRSVDRCYRKEPFHTDRGRVEYLFALYVKIVAPLAAPEVRSIIAIQGRSISSDCRTDD